MRNVQERTFMYNLFFNIKRSIYVFLTFFTFVITFITISTNVSAMKPVCYDYKTLLEKMPSGLKSKEYLYESDGVALLAFCTYKDTGNNYRTSMKHSGDTLYYCINYTNHFTENKGYVTNNSVYSDELRARIALALHLGTSKWNKKANKAYTTDNFVEDYYMTQIVIHCLINKYGGKYKDHGVDFDNIVYKKNTATLEKKTKALYKACCGAIYSEKTGSFQKNKFSFSKLKDNYLHLNEDNSCIVSNNISCNVDEDNAAVSEFKRTSSLINSANEIVLSDIIDPAASQYNSDFSFKIASDSLNLLTPGVYTAKVDENVNFNKIISKEWKCTDKNFENNQEVVGISYTESKADDSFSLKFLVGNVELCKTDSITGEIIPDAEFQVLQFDNTTGDYTFYKNLSYDAQTQKYTSGNLYISANNPEGKFKVIESKAGLNYVNDWVGHEFVIDENNLCISITAENSPLLGKLHIHKDGNNVKFDSTKNSFSNINNKVNIPSVSFDLFADEDISFKGKMIYKKDQKILDIKTDDNGDGFVNDLIPGKYYIKETNTNPLYVLDDSKIDFIIKKENGIYPEQNVNLTNKLKNCSIEMFKYTTDINCDPNSKNATKIPISNCTFGIYSLKDICDPSGNIIVPKDTLIKQATSNDKGEIVFKDLLYADYYIKELNVPDGIILNNEPTIVNKDKFELIPNATNEYLAKLHLFNAKQKYKINLVKYGEQFYSADQHDNDNGTYYSYNLQYGPLIDVSYALYNENNEKLMVCKSDSKGIINFEPLEYGNYYCIEESAPANYLIDTNPINIKCTTLQTKDSESGIINVEQSVNDNMCDCTIRIQKTGEKSYIDNNKLAYSNIPLEGVVFGIYQDFDYTFTTGTVLPQNTCVGFITTDDKGLGTYNCKLPEGAYYLKELKTLKGYELDTSLYQFEIKANNNQNIDIDLTNEPIKNILSKSSVKIIKTDVNTGKRLKGVEFTLYNQNKQKIGVYKTNKKGEIIITELPYGNYYFLESKSLRGYYSSNNQYKFTLNSSEEKVLEITNTPILKLGFNEHYMLLFIVLCIIIIGGFILIYNNEFRKNNKKKE